MSFNKIRNYTGRKKNKAMSRLTAIQKKLRNKMSYGERSKCNDLKARLLSATEAEKLRLEQSVHDFCFRMRKKYVSKKWKKKDFRNKIRNKIFSREIKTTEIPN